MRFFMWAPRIIGSSGPPADPNPCINTMSSFVFSDAELASTADSEDVKTYVEDGTNRGGTCSKLENGGC